MNAEALRRIAEAKATQAITLDLDNIFLNELPTDPNHDLWNLKNLKVLSLSGNELTEVPDPIGNLTDLVGLSLSRNKLVQMPKSIGNLSNLKTLDLSRNQLVELPECMENLTNLLGIYLYDNKLTEVPRWITKLVNLQILALSGNQLTSIPEFIGEITTLKELALLRNGLTKIPKSIGNLVNLNRLDLAHNRLTEVPRWITKLARLTNLSLSGNQLTSIPGFIGEITTLTQLDLYMNRLTKVPESIGNLTNLTELDLFDTGLTEIPEWIANLTNLKELDVANNHLTKIPKSIENLVNLTMLDLHRNQLTEVPEWIASLVKLKKLDISSNQLTNVPEWIANLTNLTEFELSDNPLEDIGPDILAEGTEAILAFLRGDRRRQWVSKLLLVGEGGVGKTSILKRLSGKQFNRAEKRTHMLAVRSLPLPHPNEENITMTLNCWDFGGQDIYHATHQFYLTQRSLYLLVWNARTGFEQSKLYRWMETIKTRAGDGVPVLLVATHTEGNAVRFPYDDLKRQYPQIIGSLEVDSESGKGIEQLRNRIQDIAGDKAFLPLMGEKWPAKWLKATTKLRKRKEHCLTKSEFDAFMNNEGITGDDLAILTVWLHELGHILYFPDTEVLREYVILNPQWVIARIANVLDSADVINRKGLLTREEMDAVWSDLTPPIRDYLLHLMEQFDLSYRTLDDRNRSLIVEAVPYDESPYLRTWISKEHQPEVRMRYRLTTLPAGIPTWFIARSFRYTVEDNLHWRLGGLFQDVSGKHLALIQAFPATNTVELTVRGPMPGYFFSLLRDTFEYTLARFTKIIAERTLPCPCQRNCPGAFPFEVLHEADFDKTLQCHHSRQDVSVGQLLLGIADISIIDRILNEPDSTVDNDDVARDRVEYLHRQFLRRYRIQQRRILERCPNVYRISQAENAKLNPTEEAYHIHLYCQYPGDWHEIGGDCQFIVRQSKEAWEKAAPWLSRGRKFGSAATGTAAAVLGFINPSLAVPFGIASAILGSMGDFERHPHALPDGMIADARRHAPPDVATDEEYQVLIRLLKDRNPDGNWCGLRIVEMQDGTYAWLCPDHYRLYVQEGRLKKQ